MSVEVQHLTKVYGSQKAIDDLNFTIGKGSVIGFLGPNGAGKSTTMKILTCFLEPTSGSAKVAGYDIFKDSRALRREVGYLPEHNPLYPEMYVKEYLRFAAGLSGVNKGVGKKVDELISKTGLGLEQHKKIHQLSKGYRQRVGLAQAMIHDPSVLILDEPTSGLDPNQIVEIRKLISELGSSKTVILSTHIMQEVKAMCDRVIILNKGKMVADKPIEELLEGSSEKARIEIAFKKAVDPKKIAQLSGVEKVTGTDREFSLICDSNEQVREQLFKLAVDLNNPIMALERKKEDLENVFRQLTDQ